MALGHSEQLAFASLRFGIGRFNTLAEIEKVGRETILICQSLRQSQRLSQFIS
jgi:cysteine desulfurase